MFNVGSAIKINTNGFTQSCKIVQARQGKIKVEYVNCPNKPDFLLNELSPSIITPKYMLRSTTQVLPMNMPHVNSMETMQLHDPAPINAPILTDNQHGDNSTVTLSITSILTSSATIPSS